MAQDISLLGAVYQDVPAVQLPKQGGGTAQFDDTSDGDAVAGDLTLGKIAYSNGVRLVGTNQGGGGSSGDGYVWQDGQGYVHLSDEEGTQTVVESLSVTQNGTYTAQSGHAYSPVVVNVPSGGGSAEEKQVNFIDYNGTILYSYTASEANALTELPANPSHTGLVAQGWNWTLAQIKAQLTAVPDGPVWVGQMYITASGDTEIDVEMKDGRLSPNIGVGVDGTITIDWGDNTTPDTITGTSESVKISQQHTYSSAGNYTIIIHVVSGSFRFVCTSSVPILFKNSTLNENYVYVSCIKKIRLGSNITKLGDYSFRNCRYLTSVTIPNTITSIGTYAFESMRAIPSITIPNGVTSIDTYCFQYCYSLFNISIPYALKTLSNYAFASCYSLPSITIPDGVTNLPSNVFAYCYNLSNVSIPDTVTSINANVFSSCFTLSSIAIPDGVTSIGNYAFASCYCFFDITIPDTVTSISNYTFQYCYGLKNITIPDTVTSIGNNAFQYCNALSSITIPDSVTSIGTNAFQYCYGISSFHIEATTPPTLSNINAFDSISSDCIIYVPYSVDHSILEAYRTTTNWSTYASYMQEEPQ